ncbi:MAG: N-6 DNA methylase [Gemmatimonadota bacterium]|nr:N-6 DNA methylase [Gemmatimonadota bacterium]
MKRFKTAENSRLACVDSVIGDLLQEQSSGRTELRIQLLEATASCFGGFDLEAFQAAFGICPILKPTRLTMDARAIVRAILETGIHPALCLSALARESFDDDYRRSHGIYHTDFRLALHLARSIEEKLAPQVTVIDPACGSGMLLIAASIVACSTGQIPARHWLRHNVYAADLSPSALRATMLSLSSLTDDLEALIYMRKKWKVQDSLLVSNSAWIDLATDGFDIVVGNPPWEKVKLTRHEFIKANGWDRHYGEGYEGLSLSGYEAAKQKRAQLAMQLSAQYSTSFSGDRDLYIAFTQLSLSLTRQGGSGALLVPAGLIRSLNTRYLREQLVAGSKSVSITIMDNRARHFSIDTRFKFLLVNYSKRSRSVPIDKSISIVHARTSNDVVVDGRAVELPIIMLRKIRPDLTLPEVRTLNEWRLFKKMQLTAVPPSDESSSWYPVFCREVDMTHGRSSFVKSAKPGYFPVIEGRMVQPHRLGCKSYVSGEGRSAKWRNLPPGKSQIEPQFWISLDDISEQALKRVGKMRAGFCDITGQTNERSMMAALVKPNLVCGNKVPTIEFPNDPTQERLFLWLSIVNSLPFDWLLRRVVTTTVNYFVLISVRLPDLNIESSSARRLIAIARELSLLDACNKASFELLWHISNLRAEADVLVANAYGCVSSDLRLMLRDFPLLDRRQPALVGEEKSTVTSDLLFHTWNRSIGESSSHEEERVSNAKALGAIGYLSSEFVASILPFRDGIDES